LTSAERPRKMTLRNASNPVPASMAASLRVSSLLLCLFVLVWQHAVVLAQDPPPKQDQVAKSETTDSAAGHFRLERTAVSGGGELLTIWGRMVGGSEPVSAADESQVLTEEIPLVSVLRDTLGDTNRENDVLRDLWVHTYVRPKLVQQAAALVPFLYKGLRVDPHIRSTSPPRAIINFSDAGQSGWRRLFVSGAANVLIDQPLLKASVNNYRRNIADYRKSNVMRALTVLSLYESEAKEDSGFSEVELVHMQAQLGLTEKTLGGLVDENDLPKFYEKEITALRDTRGHNWELLRQQTEASGLHFEPLCLPDSATTHALVWISADDLRSKGQIERPFAGRFLNIKDPWQDKRLTQWRGYTETKFFSNENQQDSVNTTDDPENRAVKMIPLALYGLDFKKIPALLIDFRDSANPRRRELSGRLINDIARDVLSVSRFGNIYYFLARSAFDFVTSRRGIDINQPSRLRSAAELRLLLLFNPNISNGLRAELNEGLEGLSVNPLESGGEHERKLALAQYRALQHYALRSDGLSARLERQRAAEMARFVHRGWDGKLMRLANILTLGRYTHREKLTPELRQRLNTERQLAYHTRRLREIARSSPVVEVVWKMELVMPSLRFVAENGSLKDNEAARAVGSIFSRTRDAQARDLCFSALKRIGNKVAMKELLRIYKDPNVPGEWRAATAEYLKIQQPQRPTAVGSTVGANGSDSQLR